MAVYAYGEAARHLERALEVQDVLDPDDRGKRCDLLLALGEALMPAGEPLRAANEVASEAFALAEAEADSGRAARAACLGLEGLHRALAVNAAGTSEWHRWAQRADQHAAPGTPQRALADIGLARAQIARGQVAEGIVLLQRALNLAWGLDDPELLFTAGWQAILNQLTVEHWRESVALAEELIVRPRLGVSPRTLGQGLEWCGVGLLVKGDRDGAEAAWGELDELAQRSRDPFNRLNSMSYQGLLATMDGRLEQAVAIGERMRSLGEELGIPAVGYQFAFSRIGKALLHLGRFQDFGSWRHNSGPAGGPPLELPYVGKLEEVAGTLFALWNQRGIEEGKAGHVLLPDLCDLLELALATSDRARARFLSTLLAAAPGVIWRLSRCLPRLLGGAAALLGEPEKARGYYQQAIDVCTRARFRPELALTRLQLTELLLELYPEERAAAIEHLDSAIAEFRDMKMQPSLERALRHRELLKA